MVKNMKTLNASKVLKNYGTLIGYILVLIAFTILAPGRFMTPQNMIGILRQIAMLGTISIGLTFVMITKRSDLSIGYSTSFLGIFVAALLVHAGMNIWLAAILTVARGALIGLINGTIIAYLGVPDFIGSLGVGYVVAGINQAYTKGHPVSNLPANFQIFGAQKLFDVIPNAVIIMALVLLVSYVILRHTRLGRYIYAVGDNEEATLMSGIDTKKTVVWSYVFCGIACAVTAVMLTSRLGSAHPQAAEDYLLNAIAAVWLGSTAFKDGEPNLAGTVLGALIIGTMANGLTIMNVSYYYQDIATGLIILLAVIITSIQRQNKK